MIRVIEIKYRTVLSTHFKYLVIDTHTWGDEMGCAKYHAKEWSRMENFATPDADLEVKFIDGQNATDAEKEIVKKTIREKIDYNNRLREDIKKSTWDLVNHYLTLVKD